MFVTLFDSVQLCLTRLSNQHFCQTNLIVYRALNKSHVTSHVTHHDYIVTVQLERKMCGDFWCQFKFHSNSIQIQFEFNSNSIRIQFKFNSNSILIQFNSNSILIQIKYKLDSNSNAFIIQNISFAFPLGQKLGTSMAERIV